MTAPETDALRPMTSIQIQQTRDFVDSLNAKSQTYWDMVNVGDELWRDLHITPELVIREGDTAEEILKLIDEDEDISVLVLAAGVDKEGPGPLVASLGTTAGTFPVPMAIVPGHLSDEDLDAMS